MAGIGFELKKIYGKKTLWASFEGVVYSAFTIAGPTVAFASLLLVLNKMMAFFGVPPGERSFFVSSFTHAFVVGLLVSVMISSVLSRYISDKIFLSDDPSIAASIWGVLTTVTVGAGLVLSVYCIVLRIREQAPLRFLVLFYLMGILAAISYTMMTYISALKEYRTISIIFVFGVALIVVLLVIEFSMGYLRATAVYFAMVAGFLLIDIMMILCCVRRFGAPSNNYFAFLASFRRHPGIFTSGTVYGVAFYLSNLVYWHFSDMQMKISIFPTAPNYDRAMFISIFINLPALIIFSVYTETEFYEKYVQYLSALNGGKFRSIEKARELMIYTMERKLFFVYEAQLAITLTMVLLSIVAFPYWGINTESMGLIAVLAFAVYSTLCMYFTMTFLYYFDDGTDAAWTTVLYLLVESVMLVVVLNSEIRLYCLPMLAAGLIGWLFCFWRLKKLMTHIDGYILCKGGE